MSESSHPRRVGMFMFFLMWIVLLGGLTFFFYQWTNPRQYVATTAHAEVVLQSSRGGHFVGSGYINGQRVEFLVDTGATSVIIPAHIAQRLGLPVGGRQQAHTANGIITVYTTQLDSIGIGPLRLRNIGASINPYAGDDQILLGMSFLRHLNIVQRDGTLRLSVPADSNGIAGSSR